MDLFLAENKDEVFNGYFDNDMFNIVFEIKDYGNGNYLLENVRNTYSLKADNKYMYYSSKRVNFRKVNGDETKILNAFSKFVERLYASLLEDIKADKIHDSFKELLNSKIGD